MMETDTECPSCHASAASATSAAPQPFAKPSNLLKVLPVFGGAIGGVVYAALNTPAGRAPARGPGSPGTRSSAPFKLIFGVLFILGGGLFVVMAFVHFRDTWKIARRAPHAVSAAELRQAEKPESLPAAWLAYTFDDSKPTELTVTRRRLGQGGDVKAHCLLVKVEDKWLIATVAPGFEGNKLVGRLLPLDSIRAHDLLEGIQKIEPNPSALLPFEFNAVDGSASDQRERYIRSGWFGIFGLVAGLLGLRLVCGRQSTPAGSSTAIS
jgi:hypothetical protein